MGTNYILLFNEFWMRWEVTKFLSKITEAPLCSLAIIALRVISTFNIIDYFALNFIQIKLCGRVS